MQGKDILRFELIETKHTKAITCPWCGCKFDDSEEYFNDEGEVECDECSKTFWYSRKTVVTYNSWRLKK
jgi:uncharacterized Zn-finger protein